MIGFLAGGQQKQRRQHQCRENVFHKREISPKIPDFEFGAKFCPELNRDKNVYVKTQIAVIL